jgi:hypothetical protein
MKTQSPPFPPGFTPAEFSMPTFWSSPGYTKALVQESLAEQCNTGQVNGWFTQAQFDEWWSQSFGSTTIQGFEAQELAFQAAVKASGVGTLTPGPAGTYINE